VLFFTAALKCLEVLFLQVRFFIFFQTYFLARKSRKRESFQRPFFQRTELNFELKIKFSVSLTVVVDGA